MTVAAWHPVFLTQHVSVGILRHSKFKCVVSLHVYQSSTTILFSPILHIISHCFVFSFQILIPQYFFVFMNICLNISILVRHSLYKLNRIGDKQHPCLTPLPVCTLLVSPRSSRILTLWSMYSLLINLLYANRYHLSLGSALIRSSLHGQMPCASLWSKYSVLHPSPKFILLLFSSFQSHP